MGDHLADAGKPIPPDPAAVQAVARADWKRGRRWQGASPPTRIAHVRRTILRALVAGRKTNRELSTHLEQTSGSLARTMANMAVSGLTRNVSTGSVALYEITDGGRRWLGWDNDRSHQPIVGRD